MIEQTVLIRDEKIDRAFKYYSIISILKEWKLKNKHLELLAFTAVRGTITPPSARAEFISRYNSSKDSLNNLKSQLTRKGLMIKDAQEMYRVHPKLAMNFDYDNLLQIYFGDKTGNSKGSGTEDKGSTGDS